MIKKIAKPHMVVGFGMNHRCVADGRETPTLFMKAKNSIISEGETIEIPEDTEMAWAEAELAIVIGCKTKRVSYEQAKQHIMGYTIANDISRVNIHQRSGDLAYAKCCDSFLPLKLEAHVVDPLNLKVKSYINDKLVQSCSTSDFIFDVYEAVSYASRYFTLEEGDVIITGTDCKARNRTLADGDKVTIEIEKIGSLTNFVRWLKR